MKKKIFEKAIGWIMLLLILSGTGWVTTVINAKERKEAFLKEKYLMFKVGIDYKLIYLQTIDSPENASIILQSYSDLKEEMPENKGTYVVIHAQYVDIK